MVILLALGKCSDTGTVSLLSPFHSVDEIFFFFYRYAGRDTYLARTVLEVARVKSGMCESIRVKQRGMTGTIVTHHRYRPGRVR